MPDYAHDLPENYYYSGGGGTFGTPLAVAFLILAVIFILTLPRKYAFVPFLFAGLLIPLNVSLVISSLSFNSNRLLLLAGLARILARKEWFPGPLNSLDKVVLFGALVNSVAYSLVWKDSGAIVNRFGFLFSILGTYFFLRAVIRTKDDVIRVIKVLALIVAVIAPIMWSEHISKRNVFSLVGAPEISSVRLGKVRAQGPFAHSIIAGTFGVVLIPLFIGLWLDRPHAWLIAALGCVSSVLMMIASSSSTPIMSLPAGIIALSVWPLREKMKMVRWWIVVMLVVLQMILLAPIWFVVARITGVLGGSGWHRAMLIDNFLRRFFDWFLIGTKDNPNWGWSMWDVDNAYVGAGLTGGLLGFILFIYVFVFAYRMIGVARSTVEDSGGDARLIWATGAALFANSIAFFGIVYFDQSIIMWYALLVMISVITVLPTDSQGVSSGTAVSDPPFPLAAGDPG